MNGLDPESLSRPQDVARAFLTPQPPRQWKDLVLDGSETLEVDTPAGHVVAQRAGTGPSVLLLHGWQGQASDLAAFAPALLESGFGVLAIDLPAHGASSGAWAGIPQLAAAVSAVGRALGPFDGVIAHSMGAAVLAEAMHTGLEVRRVVMIAAPAYYERHAREFAAAAGLDSEGTTEMLAALRGVIGVDMAEISLPGRAPHFQQPVLFMHSGDDRVVPIEESLESASAWPGARHVRVEGLGHRRILASPAVVDAVMAFITTHTERSIP
jgi:pimeloyl-ACP methyl ester carboxylesterase